MKKGLLVWSRRRADNPFMHGGIVAADTSLERLVAALADAGEPLERLGPRRADQDINTLPAGILAGVEAAGRTYIFDNELVLSTATDAVVAASGRASCLIVATMVESASGSGMLVVADRGRVVRSWSDIDGAVQNAGETLASEHTEPLDTVDGAGQWAVLRSLGFEPDDALNADQHELLVSRVNWEDSAFWTKAEARLRAPAQRRGLIARLLGRG